MLKGKGVESGEKGVENERDRPDLSSSRVGSSEVGRGHSGVGGPAEPGKTAPGAGGAEVGVPEADGSEAASGSKRVGGNDEGTEGEAAGAAPDGDRAEIDRLEEACRSWERKATAAEEALQAERERALRLQADFENFRRRTRQEQAELSGRALDSFLKELLPVLDNFDRAVDAAEASGGASGETLLQGVEMVRKQLVALLAAHGVEAMAAVGQPFDPHQHEAVQRVDADGYARDTVTEEWRKGYVKEGRVLRPAMVKVAVGTGDTGGAPSASEGS